MNKGICDKIKLVLWGLTGRIEENIDYIKNIKFVFTTGLKKIEGEYFVDKASIIFNGREDKLIISDIPDFLSKEALNYDSLEFTLEERGSSLVVSADKAGVKTKKFDGIGKDKEVAKTSQVLKRNYLVKVGEADDLLREIGILTKDGKVKNDMVRKYNQIDHFVELIDSMIDEVSKGTETITILDCGCGKSYLTFVLNYYIKEKKKKNCYFIGIDRSEQVIESSKKIAKNLGYKNMEFIADDINFYEPSRNVDIVLSLHACDTATDMALGLGIRLNSKAIMCVPCCHKEVLSQYDYSELDSILKHGVFKARFADMLTDGIRSLLLESQGYKVSVVEYISPLETPKNLLIRAVKTSDKNEKAYEEYMRLRNILHINPSLETYINIYE